MDNNEDLLVTNAFYPIAVLSDNGLQQAVRVDYNYAKLDKTPYEAEQMGPYPNIQLTHEKKYDEQTARDFKGYLKKKGQHTPSMPSLQDSNAAFLDTTMENGNMPVFFDKQVQVRGLKIRKITINVDSRQRNTALFPNPYAYTFSLPFKIQNIKYVEMVSSEIPFAATTASFSSYMFVCSKYIADVEKSYTVDNIFAKVQLIPNQTVLDMVFNGHLLNATRTTFVDTPLDQLSELEIELKNPDNTYYDVSGRDHSFTLVFTVYIDTITNSFISSRRGIQDKTN